MRCRESVAGVARGATFLQNKTEEGAERGERLDHLGEHRLGQVPADEGQDGAEAGIAGGLAEAGEKIGKRPGDGE